MLLFEDAQKIVLDSARTLSSEEIHISQAVNRILAEDIKSDMDIPPSDRSVMDGYACRRQDLHNELTVVETIPAGIKPGKRIQPNQCAKIMTGAPIPEGADCVIKIEQAENPTDKTVRFLGENTEIHIRRKGEDIKTGQVVLQRGTLIKPQHIAIMATTGHTKVQVSRRPKVGIIATGDELVEPQNIPNDWQVRNSNSLQLSAQLENIGAQVTYYGIARDTVNDINRLFKTAAAENDIITVSGGVSMGDFDLVPDILKQNQMDLLFEKIALKPGKPLVFGISENRYCFGVPGNPVSTFVVFELLIKPFLYRLMGHDYNPLCINMPLAETVKRSDTERMSWIPVKITNDAYLKTIEYHGSAHISALNDADGIISIEIGIDEIPKGTFVKLRLF